MRSPIPILLALVGLVAGSVRGEDARGPDPLPLRSEGDLSFDVDFAGFRKTGAPLTDQEIYVSVTNDEIGFSETDGGFAGELRLEIVVRTADEKVFLERESRLVPQAATELDADDRGILQIIRERVELPAGLYHFALKLVDEKTVRTGLFNKMRRSKRHGTATGWVEVREFTGPGLVLSDLTLVRSSRASPDGSFGRSGVDFDPNPSRLYGLVLPMARCYLEVYAGEAFEPGTSFLIRTRLLDRSGSPALEKTTRAVPVGEAFVITDELPLRPREVVAGSYALDVVVFNESTGETRGARRPLDVIWSVSSWGQDPEELFEEMALLMRESEYKKLQGLSAGAREIYLAEYWRDLDPDPDTPENEAFATFRRRVAFADREFESTLQRGILTDRGRVYVRYGPPDDTDFHFNSSDFGSGSGERVAGPGERQSLRNRPSASFLDPDQFREGDVSDVAGQTGGVNIQAKALEVWVYNGQGRPLTRQQLDPDSHRGLKFIFADEMGDGNYQLISSQGASLF